MNKQGNKEMLSAHELNQYAYCPFQWYYERQYGRQEIRRRYRQRMQQRHLTDTVSSQFVRGVAFHQKIYRRYSRIRLLRRLGILAIAVVAAYLVIRYGLV